MGKVNDLPFTIVHQKKKTMKKSLQSTKLKLPAMATEQKGNSNRNSQQELQDTKIDEDQLQIVKHTYSNAYVESHSKLKTRDFYFVNQMIEIKQSGKNDHIATRVWDASIVLTHYLDKNAKQLQIESKIILEIGCGLGLCSIVCSLLNAKHVYLTDIDKNCMELATENIKNNKCKNNISVHEYYWGSNINQTTMEV
eukprot:301495_1